MLKNKLFYATVVALLLTLTGVTAVAADWWAGDYWTWTHTFVSYYKNSLTGVGNWTSSAPEAGQLNPAYGDYNQQNTIQYSLVGSSPAQTFLSIKGSDNVLIRPDGFSFNNNITSWMAADPVNHPDHARALLFTVVQNIRNVPEGGYYTESIAQNPDPPYEYYITTTTVVDGSGVDYGTYQQNVGRVIPNPDYDPEVYQSVPYLQTWIPNPLGSQYTSNDNVRVINATGWEVVVVVGEDQKWTGSGTLGIIDRTWKSQGEAGRLLSGAEYALGDFQPTDSEPDPLERIYFSAGRYVMPQLMSARIWGYRSLATWPLGSDYGGRANAGDVLTQYTAVTYPDPENPLDPFYTLTLGVFERAYKIAGYMVNDPFWTVGGGSLKWNTWNGYVSTSSASNAPEATGHSVVKNFMQYVFDITAMKVQDYDGDGVFDLGQDLILFSVMSDRAFDQMRTWTNVEATSWMSDAYFAGQYFDGDGIFLYDGYSVVTYMDRGTNVFYGQPISTGNATIWGEKWGEYDLTGFALTYVPIPEPTTVILIIGGALATAAGLLRRKFSA